MNYRLSITAAVAVILASFSLLTVIQGTGWLWASVGAVLVVGAAGLATRLAPIPAAAIATGLVLVASVPLLTWPSWPVRSLGVVLIVIAAASAGVRTVLPALADVGTYLAALLIYLNLVFAGPQSLGWIIPTARSMRHLGTQASLGYAEHQFAPPVPGIHGIELIAAAGVGAVAILTDVLAVRMRSPAVAGLPLLVLFSVPVATNVKHVGAGLTLAFCAGITGYLALLAADGRERLRLWGRLVTVWQDEPAEEENSQAPDTRALAASGRRIGLAAVAVAVVVPLALPGLKEHGLFGKTPVAGAGSSPVAPPAPLVQMRSQLFGHSNQPFLTYQTNSPDPSQQYLQVYVLNYDNRRAQWTLTDRSPSTTIGSAALRSAPGLAPATNFTTSRTTIRIGKTNGYTGQMNYLPAPYAPQFVTVPGSGWQETNSTLMLYGYRSDSGLTYTVTSRTADPTLAQLSTRTPVPAAIKNSYLVYAGPDRARLTQIAHTITKGATTPFGQAEALQAYFTQAGSFTYSLRDPASTVLKFLTTDKRGFCQQFAFSMAVLARLIGIPSRIAVGYTAGSRIGHHMWKVTTADAHAWPELYFPGAGWLRFEPTPSGPAAQGTATTPVYASEAGGAAPTTNPITGQQNPLPQGSTGPGGTAPQIRKPAVGTERGGTTTTRVKHAGFPVGPVIGVIVVLLLIAPGVSRVVIRRRRWLTASDDAGRAHAAWRELSSDLTDYGLTMPMSDSPRAVARRVADAGELDGPAREAVRRVATAEERARYARTPGASDSLQADVHLIRRALGRAATRGQRWRARLFPPSTLAPVWSALRQVPDVFSWLDVAALRIRRSIRRPAHPEP